MKADIDIAKVWHEATERVKDRVIHPTLWRALELACPILVEDDQFVVGFGPGHMHLAGHLQSAEHRNAIEAAIAGACGKRLTLVVIDGTGQEEWKHYKARQRAASEARDRVRERIAKEARTIHTWDGILEQVGRAYANLNLRQLPQIRGQYIQSSLEVISGAMDELYDETNPDEPSQRALARVIDRVATLTEVPSAIIALELVRYRKSR